MKPVCRSWLVLSVVLALCTLFPVVCGADGKAFKYGDRSAFVPLAEKEQVAAIVHRDGVEKMVIAVNFDLQDSEHAVWIFPVPAKPSQVKVDVLDAFPQLRGHDPREMVRENADIWFAFIRGTQIYAGLLEGLMLPTLGRAGFGQARALVHEEVEKWGIHTEVVTADSLEALTAHLQERKVHAQNKDFETFAPYLNADYSLVITWISSRDQLLKEFPEYAGAHRPASWRMPCLYSEFATEKPFYPMRPTSAYGPAVIPVRLYVAGSVKPAAAALPSHLTVKHFRQHKYDKATPTRFFTSIPEDQFDYTLIEVKAPATEFTDDFRFEPCNPFSYRYADWLDALSPPAALLLGIVVTGLLSSLSAGFVGFLMFRNTRTCALLGLWNLLTLFGLWIGVRNARGDLGEKLNTEGKLLGRRSTRRDDFCIFVSLVFVVLTVGAQVLNKLLLGW